MPSKIKRFYFSTCLPVLAVSFCLTAQPAKAGFEWTAPEQPAPAQQEQSALPDVATPMPDVATPMPTPAPAAPVLMENTEEPEAETPAPAPVPSADVAQEKPQPITRAPSGTDVPEVSEPALEEQKPAENNGVEINPYPGQAAAPAGAETPEQPVILPMHAADGALADMPALAPEEPVMQEEGLPAPAQEAPQFEIVEGFGSDMPLAMALRQVIPPHYAFSFGAGVNPGIRVSWNGGKPWNQVASDMLTPVQMALEVGERTVVVTSLVPPGAETPRADITPLPEEIPEEETMNTPQETRPALPEEDQTVDMTPQEPVLDNTAAAPVGERDTGVSRKNILDPGALESLQPPQEETEAPSPETSAGIAMESAPEAIEDEIVEEVVMPLPAFEEEEEEEADEEEEQQQAVPVPLPEKLGAPDLGAMRVWDAKKGGSMKELLYRWSKESGVNMIWNDSRDYKLSSNVFISGTFENALKVLFSKGVEGAPEYTFTAGPHPELVVGR